MRRSRGAHSARLVRHAVVLAAAWGAAACAGPSAEQQVESGRSWIASVQLAREQLHRGATTSRYTEELRDAADQALAEMKTSDPRVRRVADSLAFAIRAFDVELARR